MMRRHFEINGYSIYNGNAKRHLVFSKVLHAKNEQLIHYFEDLDVSTIIVQRFA